MNKYLKVSYLIGGVTTTANLFNGYQYIKYQRDSDTVQEILANSLKHGIVDGFLFPVFLCWGAYLVTRDKTVGVLNVLDQTTTDKIHKGLAPLFNPLYSRFTECNEKDGKIILTLGATRE